MNKLDRSKTNREKLRPKYWRGVDAHDEPNGQILIDWELIEWAVDQCDDDPVNAYLMLCGAARVALKDGKPSECSFLASHGLVAMNYF